MQSISVHPSRAPLRTFALMLLLLCVRPALAIDFSRLWPTAGAGAVVTETRNVGHFQGLRLSTDARVVIRQGDRHSVEVLGEGNVLPLLDTYVENATLVVEDVKRFTSSSAAVVITVRRISSIATTGAVAVVAERLNVPSLALAMGGSSALSLRNVSVVQLRAALGGSSALSVSGAVDDFSAELGGSATVQAGELAAKTVSVSGSGSAQAVVWACESLRIALGGSAGVSYYGVSTPTLATSGAATAKYLGPRPPRPQ